VVAAVEGMATNDTLNGLLFGVPVAMLAIDEEEEESTPVVVVAAVAVLDDVLGLIKANDDWEAEDRRLCGRIRTCRAGDETCASLAFEQITNGSSFASLFDIFSLQYRYV